MSIEDIIEDLCSLQAIPVKQSFDWAKKTARFLNSEETESYGRKLIINILDNWQKMPPETNELWTDLVESAGFYPYLEKEKNKLALTSTASLIRKEAHKSKNLENCYFHEEQKIINEILNAKKNLIVSAPTSFGKSLLIQEIVASKRYHNIVVIQPTLALIDETRKKLRKYSDDYKIIVRTSQNYSEEKGNLFLLTAERVMEYPELPKIDFFILDEFYKLSARRDEERSDVLNNAFNLLVNKRKCNFYLLGPNIDSISEGFAERYNAEFYPTKYTLVDNITIDNSSPNFGYRGRKKLLKEAALFELLLSLRKEQTIIYCRSPRRVRYLSRTFCNYLKDKVPQINTSDDLALIDWIKKNVKIENVEGQWSLIDCLEYGIGIHDGALQKHLTSSIIRYFNDYPEKLNYLFCTTTIIEGVNTSAKNVVYFDDVKGDDIPIDFFDYSNIKGRSGRMMVHYVGRIFNFNKPPENELIKVDIPFFEQEKISDEILINIDDSDIKHKDTEQYYNIQSIPEVERQIFRENGVSVMGQKAILQQLRKDLFDKYWIIHWTGYPHKQQLRYVLSLGWDWLLKETETIRPMSIDKLVRVTFDYGISQNISELVSSNYSYFKENKNTLPEQTIIDDAVRDAFWILRHWFHYKVPKWLSVVNSLQKYVCAENDVESGDYSFYSKQIENEFVRDNLSILVEYGIPKSAIEKLEDKIPESISEDEVIQHVKDNNLLEKAGLTKYEKEVFSDNLM